MGSPPCPRHTSDPSLALPPHTCSHTHTPIPTHLISPPQVLDALGRVTRRAVLAFDTRIVETGALCKVERVCVCRICILYVYVYGVCVCVRVHV